MNPLFSRYGPYDIRRLVADYPLAWMIAPGAPIASAALLPMLGVYSEDGRLTGLLGHMSKRRPLKQWLERAPAAQFLFTGPQGYVSPEHSGRLNWGPTWNYAAVQIEAEVQFDEALTGNAVERLVEVCETGRAKPWTPDFLETRYAGMLDAIIGFEARVTAVDATFKMAQDEDDEVLARLAEAYPDSAMRNWIREMNRERLA